MPDLEATTAVTLFISLCVLVSGGVLMLRAIDVIADGSDRPMRARGYAVATGAVGVLCIVPACAGALFPSVPVSTQGDVSAALVFGACMLAILTIPLWQARSSIAVAHRLSITGFGAGALAASYIVVLATDVPAIGGVITACLNLVLAVVVVEWLHWPQIRPASAK